MTARKPARPAAPQGLQRRARTFWRSTVAVFELTDVELELLREVCRFLDEIEDLRAAVEVDGVTVEGSSGQVRVRPGVGQLRAHRIALGRLMAQLALPDVDGGALRTPASARAAAAANARWAEAAREATRG